MSDNVMYDSPTEFLNEIAEHPERCLAQSVVPVDGGGYRCACSCGRWDVVAPSREAGLELARAHTAT